jgi:hypothetical protein
MQSTGERSDMTQDQRKEMGKALAATAFYYGRQLTPEVLAMMLDDLADLPFEKTMESMKAYRLNPNNRAFPMPAQIRALVTPAVDIDSAAREIAARIAGAITKYGWARGEDAHAFIGETGWAIVRDLGGWSHLCQNHGVTIDPTAFLAQTRDLAKSRLTHSPQAMEARIGIGARADEKPKGLVSVGEILKQILPPPNPEGA